MTTTLLDIKKKALILCGEDYDLSAAVLAPAGGGSTTVTLTDALTQWANEAATDLTKTAVPVWDNGQATVTTGSRAVSFASITMTGGGTLWAVGANAVDFAGVPLTRATRHVADRDYPTRPSDANGTPVYWAAQGTQGILLAPKPASGGTLKVFGLVVPAPFSADGDTMPWIDDGSAWILAEYMAARYCESRASDSTFGPMAAAHDERYQQGKTLRLEQLSEEEKDLLLTFGDTGGAA